MPLARFADASYSGKQVKNYTIDKSLSTNNYTTYFNPKDKTAVIAFSGTRILNDPNYFGILKNSIWETDLATDWAVANNDIRNSSRYDDCIMATERFYDKYHSKGYKVATTGHSLGGRIAMDVSADMKSDGKLVIAEVYNPFFYDSRVDIDEGDYAYCIVHYNPQDPYSKNVANIPSRGHATLIPAQITKPPPAQTTQSPPAQITKPTQKHAIPHHKDSMWQWLGKEAKHHPWEFAGAVIGGAIVAVGAAAVVGPAIMGAIAGQGAVEGVAAAGAEVATEAIAEGAAEGAAETAAEGVAEDSEFVDAVSEQPEEIPKEPDTEVENDSEFKDAEAPPEEPDVTQFVKDTLEHMEQTNTELMQQSSNIQSMENTLQTAGDILGEEAETNLLQQARNVINWILDSGRYVVREASDLPGRLVSETTKAVTSASEQAGEAVGRQAATTLNAGIRGFISQLEAENPALLNSLRQVVSIGQTVGIVDQSTAQLIGVTTQMTFQTQVAAATGTILTGIAFIQAIKEFLEAVKLFIQEMTTVVKLIKDNANLLDEFMEELVGKNSHSLNQYTSHEPTSILPSTASSTSSANNNSSVVVHKSTPVLPAQKPKNHYVVKAKYRAKYTHQH